jgi:methionyl aminopeptidase
MSIFTPEELEGMKDCAWVLREIVHDLEKAVKAGVRTAELDQFASDLIEQYGVRAAFRGYRGYPACTTTSVNEEVIDGVPGPRVLKEGDLLKMQLGIESDGLHSYWANTYAIPPVSERATALVEATRRAVGEAAKSAKPGTLVEELSRRIQETVESAGFEVVRQYCGHGIGRRMHEEPQIPCYVDQRLAGRYRLNAREVIAVQVLTLEKAARLSSVGGGLTVAAPRGIFSAHVGALVAVADPPEVLVGSVA